MACRLPIPPNAQILVVRSLPGLGDLLCGVPALRSLRAAYPSAKITYLGLPSTEWFGQRFAHLVDEWLPFPSFPGIPEGWQRPQATVDFLHQMQGYSYDLTLQIHGSGNYINPFLMLMGGNYQAGFYLPGQYCPDLRYFLPYPQNLSEVERLIALMTFLGISEQGDHLEFPVDDIEYQVGLRLLDTHSLVAGHYVCLHPGASVASRRWSLEGFSRAAQHLASQGHRIVLTGTVEEHDLTNQIVASLSQPGTLQSINLAGRTSLGALAVVLRHAGLLICNDTGISHLAAALNVPSVVVFSDSEVERWAPCDRTRHRIIDSRQMGSSTLNAVLTEANGLLHLPLRQDALLEVSHVG